jgi:hypothetical protein
MAFWYVLCGQDRQGGRGTGRTGPAPSTAGANTCGGRLFARRPVPDYSTHPSYDHRAKRCYEEGEAQAATSGQRARAL